MIDIDKANQELGNSDPQEIIAWAVNAASNPLVSTNFGPYEAVILHMVTQVKADMPVVWADSGYNTRETYLVAERLIESLKLNIKVYSPEMTAARWDAAHGGIPELDSPQHEKFTGEFKLAPFSRAMREQKPDVWFTAVRSDQTEFRQNMEVFSAGPESLVPGGVIKVAPFLNWKEEDMQNYLDKHDLPNVEKYFDPTKGQANRECGLHTKL